MPEPKSKSRYSRKTSTEDALPEEDLEIGGDDEELDLAILPKGALADGIDDESDGEEEEDLDDDEEAPASRKSSRERRVQSQRSPLKPGGKSRCGTKPRVRHHFGKSRARCQTASEKAVAGKGCTRAPTPAKADPRQRPRRTTAKPALSLRKPRSAKPPPRPPAKQTSACQGRSAKAKASRQSPA